jgi:predicted aminopeptidase
VATYYDCVPGFKRLLAAGDGDLPRFYAAVRALAAKPRAERHAELCGAASPAPQAAVLSGPELFSTRAPPR